MKTSSFLHPTRILAFLWGLLLSPIHHNNHKGGVQAVSISDLQVGFTDLKTYFTGLDGNGLLNEPIPLVGRSLTEILLDAASSVSFEDVCDFLDWMSDPQAATDQSATDLRDSLITFLTNQITGRSAGIGASAAANCGGNLVEITFVSATEIAIDFCALFAYSGRVADLDAADLLQPISSLATIDVTAQLDVAASLDLSGTVTVHTDTNTADVTMNPIVATAAISAPVSLDIDMGSFTFDSDATANASTTITLTFDAPGSPLTVTAQGDYCIEGSMELQGSFTGVEVGVGAEVTIKNDDMYDLSAVEYDVTGFDLSNFIQDFDVNALVNALAGLLDKFTGLQTQSLLNSPIPLIGKSPSELLNGAPGLTFDQILDFGTFVTTASTEAGRPTLNLAEVQNKFIEYLGNSGDHSVSAGPGCDSYAVNVTLSDGVVKITFCAGYDMQRAVAFTGDGLLDGVADVAQLDISAAATLDMDFSFGAELTVDLTNFSEWSVTVEPLVATVEVNGEASITLEFGIIELESTATVNASGLFVACFEPQCGTYPGALKTDVVGTLDLYSLIEFTLQGDMTGKLEYDGIDIGPQLQASFVLNDTNVFVDPKPSLETVGLNISELVQEFDIDVLLDVLAQLADRFIDIDSFGILQEKIPLLEKSVRELITGSPDIPIGTKVNFTDFLDFMRDAVENASPSNPSRNVNIAEVQSKFFEYLGIGDGSKVETNVGGELCASPYAVDLSAEVKDGHTIITIDFCSKFTFDRSLTLQAKDLFQSLPIALDVELSAYLDIESFLQFGATLTVNVSDFTNPKLETDPLVASVDIFANPELRIALGVVEVVSTCDLNATAIARMKFCTDSQETCETDGFEILGGNFYTDVDASFFFGGDLQAGIDIPGFNISDVGASFSIWDEDVFDDVAPNYTFSNFDFENFLVWSPENAVALLAFIDSALVRVQENQALQNNVPFTQTTVASLVATGSVVTGKLVEIFVKPTPFEDRAVKSLYLQASGAFNSIKNKTTDTVSVDNSNLKLVLLKGNLTTNPDRPDEILQLDGIVECDFGLTGTFNSDSETATAFHDALASCSFDVCNVTECSVDEDSNILNCPAGCEVAVGMSSNKGVFLGTVAYTEANETLDVQLFGLYDSSPSANLLEDFDVAGFAGNSPVHPRLIPRFSNLEEFGNFLNQALVSAGYGAVSVDLRYTAKDQASGVDPKFLISVAFDYSVSAGIGFDGSIEVGDLVDVQLENSALNISFDISANLTFGVILEADVIEEMKLLGLACDGSSALGFTCDLEATTFLLDYKVDSVAQPRETIVIPAATNANTVDHVAPFFAPTANVTEKGSNIVLFTFNSSITEVEMKVFKDCFNGTDALVKENTLECDDPKHRSVFKDNAYGLIDQDLKKTPFQLVVGEAFISASAVLTGTADLSCTLLQVIEVTAQLSLSMSVTLYLKVGSSELFRFQDWINGIISVFNPEALGYIDDFMVAQAVVDGNFSGVVSGKEPFLVSTSVDGYLEEPFNIDFLNISGSGKPNVTLEVDLPNIGDIRNLSFKDIVDLLVMAMEFLIGNEENGDSLESCSGGLLGSTINGQRVFVKPLPVLGVSICDTARFLQVIVVAVQDLLEETTTQGDTTTTSFNTLEAKLESLLQDGVGGTPSVNLTTVSNPNRSDLTVDIILAWSFDENFVLTTDMEELLNDPQAQATGTGDVSNFAKNFDSSLSVSMATGVAFELSLGVEYVSSEKKINPYIKGNTGFYATFEADIEGSMSVRMGSLSGDVEFTANMTGSNKDDPMALSVGLDKNFNYYLSDPGTFSSNRVGFKQVNLSDLVDELQPRFDGRIGAYVEASIPMLVTTATFFIDVDVDGFIRGESDALFMNYSITTPKFSVPSLLDILLADPQGLIDGLNDVLKTIEEASLGRSGIVTTFPIPFVRNGAASSLGAGTQHNIVGVARRSIINTLQSGLNSVSGSSDTVAELLGSLLDMLLSYLTILYDNERVQTDCFFWNSTSGVRKTVSCSSDDPKPDSIMWDIPLGQVYTVVLPMDFSIIPNFPVVITTDPDNPPQLQMGWALDIGFGFDESDGFFFFTYPGESEEVRIDVLLSLLNLQVTINLFFLQAAVDDIDIVVGARLFVDVDKDKALSSIGQPADNQSSRDFGRITKKTTQLVKPISKLFEVGARAGAIGELNGFVFEINSDILGPTLGPLADKFLPKLLANAAVQGRIDTGISAGNSKKRRLTGARSRRASLGALSERSEFRGHRFFRRLFDDDPRDILEEGFGLNYARCPVDLSAGDKFCARVTDLQLDLGRLGTLVKDVLDNFVNSKKDGMLDVVMDPAILSLNQPVKGLSEVMGRPITVLDMAEMIVGAASGAPTVRVLIEIYLGLVKLSESFNDNGKLLIAGQCNPLDPKGFVKSCIGGLAQVFPFRRLDDVRVNRLFHMEDESALETTPLWLIEEERGLLGCPLEAAFKNPEKSCPVYADCSGCPLSCKAKVTRCKGKSIKGLSFPFVSDPMSMLGLLNGGDIGIVQFAPPDLVFGLAKGLSILLYTAPPVYLDIYFEFTVTLKLGFVLDTKGIREAVEQRAPIKALNSFALMDTFNGVDEAMVTLTGEIRLTVSVSAVIVEIGVYGGIKFLATVDLYDPFPRTSKGLVRPFELISLGNNPLEWFEFGLEIKVYFGVYIKVGLFIRIPLVGKISITLFKYEKKFTFVIVPYTVIRPKLGPSPVKVDNQGVLLLAAAKLASINDDGADKNTYQCTGLNGTKAEEFVECRVGLEFSSGEVKAVGGSGSGNVVIKNVQSDVDLRSFSLGTLTMDYSDSASTVFSSSLDITIESDQMLAGSSLVRFGTVGGGAKILLPAPELAGIFTSFGGGCNDQWDLQGFSNIILRPHELTADCQFSFEGGEDTAGVFELDWGFEDAESCSDGNIVTLSYDTSESEWNLYFKNAANGLEWNLDIPKTFQTFFFKMSKCEDTVTIESTSDFTLTDEVGSISIETGQDNDNVFIGPSSSAGLENIYFNIFVDGGSGIDSLTVSDATSSQSKSTGILRSGSLDGLLNGINFTVSTLEFTAFDNFDLLLSSGANTFEIGSTPASCETTITAQDAADWFLINATLGNLNLNLGNGNDEVTIHGLGDSSLTTIASSGGLDTLVVDGTNGLAVPAVNQLDRSTLRWEGASILGITTQLSSVGDFNFAINADVDSFVANCNFNESTLLFREDYMANVHDVTTGENSTRETITQTSGTIAAFVVNLNEGPNKVYFDDTFAVTTVNGGSDVDEFYVGQRDDEQMFTWTTDTPSSSSTARGFDVSDGTSHQVTLNGGSSGDLFFVKSNGETMTINGDGGDDMLEVFSYVTAYPNYISNPVVTIDSGAGFDSAFIFGTPSDDNYTVEDAVVAGSGIEVTFSNFEAFSILTYAGADTVQMKDSDEIANNMTILAGTGNDIITLGGKSGPTDGGLDSILVDVFVDAEDDVDTLYVDDRESVTDKSTTMTSDTFLNILGSSAAVITYENVENVETEYSQGINTITVDSTPAGSTTVLEMQDSDDVVNVLSSDGDLIVFGGGGDDRICIYSLTAGINATVYGDDGNDTLCIDGTNSDASPPQNLLAGSLVLWSGGLNDDTLDMKLAATGSNKIEIFEDMDGINDMNLECFASPTVLLSRESYLANIHDTTDPNSSVETITLMSTATLNAAMVDLNAGENVVHFDDTMCPYDVIGGPTKDEFYVGQIYNSAKVTFGIETVTTREGYASNGNSHPITLNGQGGDDKFDITRNMHLVDIKGDTGSDNILVRSMVNLDTSRRRELSIVHDYVGAMVGDGADPLDFPSNHGVNDDDFPLYHFAKLEDPDYVVNSLVRVDGGTFGDTLTLIGTEGDDSLVVADGDVLGGGLNLNFIDVEDLFILTLDGYDRVTQPSSSFQVATYLYGSVGTDQFLVAPRVIDSVVSRNLRGHRGVLEHGVASDDEDYDMMYVPGISVNILGKDGDYGGYVNVYDGSGIVNHVITEGSNDEFSFFVYPTSPPENGMVVVNVVSQSDSKGERYLKFNGIQAAALELFFTTIEPQEVVVTYNDAADRLTVTDYNCLIKANLIYPETADQRFETTEQSMLPVAVKLLPAMDSEDAVSVSVVEPSGKTYVVEAGDINDEGQLTASYDIYLRPCDEPTQLNTKVEITPSVAGQVTLSVNTIEGVLSWGNDCKVSVIVTPVDDDVSEGIHYVTLHHTVTDGGGGDIALSDLSTLSASDVLVEIHDGDMGGVIVESLGAVSTAEVDAAQAASFSPAYFQDSYRVRLSKPPSSDVTITISSTPVETDRSYPSTDSLGRDFTNRSQALLGSSVGALSDEDLVLTFTTADWSTFKEVHVGAVDDGVEEGVDLLSFAPQPSYLSYIKGPLTIDANGTMSYDDLVTPMMMFMDGETDASEFTETVPAFDGDRGLSDVAQKENLEIYNLDVRGESPTEGLLTAADLTKLNMADGVIIGGVEQTDGITYDNIEILEIRLGDGVDHFTVENVVSDTHLLVRSRGEDDDLYFNGLAPGVIANVYGGSDDDTIFIDGTNDWQTPPVNLLEASRLRWSGESGDDTMHIKFGETGTSFIDIFNDVEGVNDVNIDCSNSSTTMLSRENFVANIHQLDERNMTHPNSTVERINLIAFASVNTMIIRLNDGYNRLSMDDTMAVMDIFGGPKKDEFHVGQLFNSSRDGLANVHVNDSITTTLTTRGYLSNGNSHPITLSGEFGDDRFDILRNRKALNLNGGSGDDLFTIRSFAVLEVTVEGNLSAPDLGDIALGGGDGSDTFDFKGNDPDYVTNSAVDVDGGTGADKMIVVGTEFDDSYVVSEGQVLGGGLSISYLNIESLELSTEEGNDLVSILSTSPNLASYIYGADGTDRFVITPREVDPVVSKNLRGHRGILEHILSSEDDEYDQLYTKGIAVEILDNDGDYGGYVNVLQEETIFVMSEDGLGDFSYWIYPTSPPDGRLTVNVIPQADIDGGRYLLINGEEVAAVEIVFEDSMEPKQVNISYNPNAKPLSISEAYVNVKHDVVYNETDDDRFENAFQSVPPINTLLLPARDSEKAIAAVVVESSDGTVVAEGSNGFGASYDIYLRPCTQAMADDTTVDIVPTVDDQLVLSIDSITGQNWKISENCKVTVDVTPIDDSVAEGLHFVTLRHIARSQSNGGTTPIRSDETLLFMSNVLVSIHDDDISGVIIAENGGMTATLEVDLFDVANESIGTEYYQDSYTIRLSKEPSGVVNVTVRSRPVASDRFTPQFRDLDRDYSKRSQALVGLTEVGPLEEEIVLVFTPSDWYMEQTVYVAALDDDIEEGVDWLNFPPQPSYLSYVQGPIYLSGAESATYPAVSPPIMLPTENTTDQFEIPNGTTLDDTYLFIIEERQVDYIQIYNLDTRGEDPNVGILSDTDLTGFNMGRSVSINGEMQPDGIVYDGFEVFEMFLGDGIDILTVVNTSEAMHYVDLGGNNDTAFVKKIDGPFILHGGMGADEVTVTSDESKVDLIQALFGFDGGDDDDLPDRLIVDNSADPSFDDVLNVTRTMVEVATMEASIEEKLPMDSYIVKVRGRTGGNYTLELNDPVTNTTTNVTVPYDASRQLVESIIQRGLIPKEIEGDSCGSEGISQCSNAVKVWPIGENFAVFFVGERLNENVTMYMYTDDLEDFEPEMFQNMTHDIIPRNSDIAYGDLEHLEFYTGDHDIVVNVRGTTAITTITTQGGNDFVFISSEANQESSNAGSVRFLHGWLDYIEDDLYVAVQSGRHRLLISDEMSTKAKGNASNGDPMVLTRESLVNIHDDVGDIFVTAELGNWSDGVNLWLGRNDDRLHVSSVPSNPDFAPLRSMTSIHCGSGDDEMTVDLDENEHDGVVFAANGQAGNDLIDASNSTLDVILFGDGGNDTLIGGYGNDKLIGDFGRIAWRDSDNIFNPDGVVQAITGSGGWDDFTDGVIRTITDVYSVTTHEGGFDTIILNDGDDVGIGGMAGDEVRGDDGNDIVLGDSGNVVYYLSSTSPKLAETISCSDGFDDILYGADGDVDYLIGGAYNDYIDGGTGMDLAFGDHARIDFYETPSHSLMFATTQDPECSRGDDTIWLGSGDDLAFGGAANDVIYGEEGQDIILGDFGFYDPEVQFLPFQHFVSITHHPDDAGDDEIHGGPGDDFLLGQEHNDVIYGDEGRDDIYGGHTKRTGFDGDDELHGGDDPDAILGDNGEIIRHRIGFSGDFPWVNGMVWQDYVSPFDDEVIREIRRYDDIDYIQGDDKIYGDGGNDILHGQRGDDRVDGGDGEDEVYGELGSDTLLGGPGHDILLGDLGYIVRRYERGGFALEKDNVRNTDSEHVWKKDVVLEELGNITGMDLISRKVDTDLVSAEDIMEASLLFVANGYNSAGSKYVSSSEGGWITELIRFDMVVPYGDVLDGGRGDDVLIGQRGDDVLRGSEGNDLIIGDAGWNKVPMDMDMVRIHQIYRVLRDTSGGDLNINGVTDFGVVFAADFELFPGQYNFVDSTATIIDVALDADDMMSNSNLLKDRLGVSALQTTHGRYCLQPMFRVTPGMLRETQWMHGNDRIEGGPGENIIIGDDIRGFTGFDFSEVSQIQSVRTDLDALVRLLGTRLSTLEVDTAYFNQINQPRDTGIGYNVSVGNDQIFTNFTGQSVATGDSLTFIARTVKAGSIVERGLFPDVRKVENAYQRFMDIEWVLWDLHHCLYELHTRLLQRMTEAINGVQLQDESLHQIYLANDVFDSKGNQDLLIGDSALFFLHVERPESSYALKGMTRWQRRRLRRRMRRRVRNTERGRNNHLSSLGASSSASGTIPYTDYPFQLTVCTDTFVQNFAANLAVGDFAALGMVLSANDVPDNVPGSMQGYKSSIMGLRQARSTNPTSWSGVAKSLNLYYGRFSAGVAAATAPVARGDSFVGSGASNSAMGEFLTGNTYQKFVDPSSLNVYGGYADAFSSTVSTYDGDVFNMNPGAKVDGQVGRSSSDVSVSDTVLLTQDLSLEVEGVMETIFRDHALVLQMKLDIFGEPITTNRLVGVKSGFQCTDGEFASYIPSASNRDK